MADVAIISANYGNYDQVKTPLKQAGINAEWVMVTDNRDLASEQDFLKDNPWATYGEENWRVVYCENNDIPMRAAKFPKLYPWKFTDAPMSIWIDGSCQVISPMFAAEALDYVQGTTAIAQFRHGRQCIYDEEFASAPMEKYKDEPMRAQVDYYRSLGHPEQWGLWPTTVIARRHTAEMRMLSSSWEFEMERWSFQDQLSQPYCLRNLNIRPVEFPEAIYRNGWLTVRDHGSAPSQAARGN
jgi:hypothetical protein